MSAPHNNNPPGPRLSRKEKEIVLQRCYAGDSYRQVLSALKEAGHDTQFTHQTYYYYVKQVRKEPAFQEHQEMMLTCGLADRTRRLQMLLDRWEDVNATLRKGEGDEVSLGELVRGVHAEVKLSREISRLMGENETNLRDKHTEALSPFPAAPDLKTMTEEELIDDPRFNLPAQFLDYLERAVNERYPME